MDSGSESCNHSLDLRVCVNLVQSCLLHIQNLTTKRQNRLGRTVSRRLCGAAGVVSLYNVDFTVFRILVGTVRKLSRQRHAFQRRLSSCQITRFSRCLSRSLCHHRLLNNCLCHSRILLQENLKLGAYDTVDRSSCLAVSKLLLCLSLKLRLRKFNTDNGSQSFPDIFTAQALLIFLDQFILLCVSVERLCQSITESHNMCTTFRCCNIIDNPVCTLCVGIVMLHCDLHIHIISCALTVDNLLIKRLHASV